MGGEYTKVESLTKHSRDMNYRLTFQGLNALKRKTREEGKDHFRKKGQNEDMGYFTEQL